MVGARRSTTGRTGTTGRPSCTTRRAPAARAAAEHRAADVSFHAWLQWRLDVQLREATGDLTVVQDLPVGVHGGGADAWVWQDVMAGGATIGCPPDALNTVGQDWGSPPLVPWRLREAGYQPFVESVRATIAGAGGLRVDHVMGLFRLWWIPEGEHPAAGCYVRYPADDLLDIVCLESHRAGAVVVGEDLGTVEDGVREALSERGILGYRVLWFEDDDPADWPELAMAAVTTHDLPTVAGLWTGSDTTDVLASSDMDPDDVERGREELLARLRRDGLPAGAGVDDAVAAAYRQLGRAPSLLLTLSLEDALAEERRPNVPGTTARDNWRVPLAQPLEDVVRCRPAAPPDRRAGRGLHGDGRRDDAAGGRVDGGDQVADGVDVVARDVAHEHGERVGEPDGAGGGVVAVLEQGGERAGLGAGVAEGELDVHRWAPRGARAPGPVDPALPGTLAARPGTGKDPSG